MPERKFTGHPVHPLIGPPCDGTSKEVAIRISHIILLGVIANALCFGFVNAACRTVSDDPKIRISTVAQAGIARMRVDRSLAFAILRATATPETRGCWGGIAGNFDGQIVSAGAMQWNYGQKTLQYLMTRYRKSFFTNAAFQNELSTVMPKYGNLVFSAGCTSAVLSDTCKTALLSHQHRGVIDPDMASELEALFNSDAMVQIQFDRFLTMLTSVASDLNRLFGDSPPSPLKVKWAMDTKVQQGSFPTDSEVNFFRKMTAKLPASGRRDQLDSFVDWYSGLSGSLWEEGVRLDYKYNRDVWKRTIAALYTPTRSVEEPEKFDLLNLSFIRSRNAAGKGGAYQANTFERRASIILGHGMLGGRPF
jgi:hypothetical protein